MVNSLALMLEPAVGLTEPHRELHLCLQVQLHDVTAMSRDRMVFIVDDDVRVGNRLRQIAN
jgi:hypothetical protein